jgi:hypothetical protein
LILTPPLRRGFLFGAAGLKSAPNMLILGTGKNVLDSIAIIVLCLAKKEP